MTQEHPIREPGQIRRTPVFIWAAGCTVYLRDVSPAEARAILTALETGTTPDTAPDEFEDAIDALDADAEVWR